MSTQFTILGLLLVMVVSSAVAVVYARHESRKYFVVLQQLSRERDELDIEWGRLQLEQGAWSAHGRIERIAREKLNMRLPMASNTVIFAP
jgi:cell division protein FtsL